MQSLMAELERLPVILDKRELMKFLRVSERGLYRILKDPALNAYKDEDGEWNILRSDLERWLKDSR